MELLDNEIKLLESDGGRVILTNKRIKLQGSNGSRKSFQSIMLDKVSSVEVLYTRKVWILILGVLLGILISVLSGSSGVLRETEGIFLGLGIAIIAVAFFLLKKRHTITVTSDGGTSIDIDVKGMKQAGIANFAFQVEKAAMDCKKL